MKKRILRLGAVFCGMLLTGCSIAPSEPGTMQKMQETVQEAIDFERKLDVSVSKDAVNNALLTAENTPVKKQVEKQELRFDLEVENVPARAFFMGLVKDTDYSMFVHPSVQGSISLSMKDVTVQEALDTVNNIYGYEYQSTKQGFEIAPVTIQSRIYHLDYLFISRTGTASLAIGGAGGSGSGGGSGNSGVDTSFKQDIWQEVTDILKTIVGTQDGRSLSVSPQTGVIIVYAMPEELKRVDQFLAKVQSSLNKQVILEAKIIEVTLSDGYQAGINWGAVIGRFQFAQGGGGEAAGEGGVAGPVATKSTTTALDPRGNPTQPSFKSGSAFGGLLSMALSTASFSTFIEFLSTQGNVQVLANPRVSTLNNQKAMIKVGRDANYVSGVTTNTTPAAGGGAPVSSQDINLTKLFSGISLDVTPFIDEAENITLHVHPSITRVKTEDLIAVVGGANQVLPLAISEVRESDTVIKARNGQLVVLGGLMTHDTTEAVASIPWLGKIPYLGAIFRQTKQNTNKTELVILLKPVIVDQNKWTETFRERQKELNSMDRGFHWGGRAELFGTVRETKEIP